VGEKGRVVAISHFGASAPAKQIFSELGFTAQNVAAKAKAALGLADDDEGEEGGEAAAGPAKHGTDES
jgi:transketolase